MFYLQLALLYEDFTAGRMDLETYSENIILLAQDHQRLKEEKENSQTTTKAA
ncbi:hypothetical protein [Leptospira sp. GIMC2001]|uniref:hypothetical protein n=1 Tax=Leptospira sp. GIMC2001 TaxID=1513297 RepID=UPI00234A4932|nr:hypothetical protein [Leptospira sp. GIMC2001]WCL49967.1 hypothetical protein O4O04_03875 [Leptospira sp. GIMC2001]